MPRKTSRSPAPSRSSPRASMRPRPDAAENEGQPGMLDAVDVASMRPRPDAAENTRSSCPSLIPTPSCFNEAAARCRGKQGQARTASPPVRDRFNEAAARCRGKQCRAAPPPPHAACFNEAAARCRGKRDGPGGGHELDRPHASMRPRPDAAENVARRQPRGVWRCCFNEAAARCRGKRVVCRFNVHELPPASMRPRPDAAENRMRNVAAR